MKFTWIPFYKELSDWLLKKQNDQSELISVLKEIGITGFRDGTEKGKPIELNEIDPFTFLSYLNKFHSNERRVEILQNLWTELKFKCQVPTDVTGLPTIHPMKVHLFPWKTTRGKHDITALWNLFKQAKEGKIEEQPFQTVLDIKSVGKGKLSIVLFYTNPEKFVPLDSNTSSYLRKKKLSYTYDSFASYEKLSEEAIRSLGKKPWEISCDAYDSIPENETSTTIGSIRTLLKDLKANWRTAWITISFTEDNRTKNMGYSPQSIGKKH